MSTYYDRLDLPDIHTERLLLRKINIEEDSEDIHEWYRLPESMRYQSRRPPPRIEGSKEILRQRLTGEECFSYAVTIPLSSVPRGFTAPEPPEDTEHVDAVSIITPAVPAPLPAGNCTASPTVSGPPSLPNGGKPARTHKVIGVLGTRGFPVIGYSFHLSFFGKGYATEAVSAFLGEFFRIMPRAGTPLRTTSTNRAEGKQIQTTGYDYCLAMCDVENIGSMRVLEKCGFQRGETLKNEFLSPLTGLRDAHTFFFPRPGTQMAVEMMKAVTDQKAIEAKETNEAAARAKKDEATSAP